MKLSTKLAKVGDSLTVHMYDNGYMVEVSGRDSDDDWKTAKIMCPTLNDVYTVIEEAAAMVKE
jgi:hypothetical protein